MLFFDSGLEKNVVLEVVVGVVKRLRSTLGHYHQLKVFDLLLLILEGQTLDLVLTYLAAIYH